MGLVVPLAILSSLRLSSLSHPHHSQVESAAAPFAVPPPLPPMLLPQADSAADGDGATVPDVLVDGNNALGRGLRAGRQQQSGFFDGDLLQRAYRSPVFKKSRKLSNNMQRRDDSGASAFDAGISAGNSPFSKDWAGRNQWSRRRHYISKKGDPALAAREEEEEEGGYNLQGGW